MSRLTDPSRLEALVMSGLLDRKVAARLDHLVYSAAILATADAAQLNVIDGGLQHHVSQWPVPDVMPDPQPVDQAGCREVVLVEHTVSVPDTRDHPIMCTLPWAEKWRAYLGTPVCYRDEVIGSLCVLGREPRQWSARDRLGMEGVARLIGMSLE